MSIVILFTRHYKTPSEHFLSKRSQFLDIKCGSQEKTKGKNLEDILKQNEMIQRAAEQNNTTLEEEDEPGKWD